MLLNNTPESIPTKQCNRCRECLPLTPAYFHKNRNNSDGFNNQCKKCRAKREGFNYVAPATHGHKRCPGCDQEKPAAIGFFSMSNFTRDGLQSHCKVCRAAAYQEWMKRNPGVLAEKSRTWRANNRQKASEIAKRLYQKHKEKKSEYAKRYRAENHLKTKERNQRYARENKGRMIEKQRRRVERERNAEGAHTKRDIERQYQSQRGRCYYCECDLGNGYHTDHIIPLVRGGSDSMENIVLACAPCNQSKGTKLPHEWAGSNRLL